MWLEVLQNRNSSAIERFIVWVVLAEVPPGVALVFYLLNHHFELFGCNFFVLQGYRNSVEFDMGDANSLSLHSGHFSWPWKCRSVFPKQYSYGLKMGIKF